MTANSLHDAAREGDIEKVKTLLSNRADINAKDEEQATPLHVAALEGHKPIVDLLLANDADVRARECDGATPLHCAAISGDMSLAAVLLARNADVHARTDDGMTALHVAAGGGHKDLAKFLLGNKSVINARDQRGATPLHMAAEFGQKDLAELLLANDANIDAKDVQGATPLQLAAAKDHKELVDVLLARKRAFDEMANKNGSSGKPPAAAPSRLLCPSGTECEGYTSQRGIPKCDLQYRGSSSAPKWYRAEEKELLQDMCKDLGRFNKGLTSVFWWADQICNRPTYEDYCCQWCGSRLLFVIEKSGQRRREAALRMWPVRGFSISVKWYFLRSFVEEGRSAAPRS